MKKFLFLLGVIAIAGGVFVGGIAIGTRNQMLGYNLNPVGYPGGTPRHSCRRRLTIGARHEAGQLLVQSSLACSAITCGIADGCGLTQAFAQSISH